MAVAGHSSSTKRPATMRQTTKKGHCRRLYCGDNLAVMKALLREKGPCIDLCYMDPPFNSARRYTLHKGDEQAQAGTMVFDDTWKHTEHALAEASAELKKIGIPAIDDYLRLIDTHYTNAYTGYLTMMALRLHYARALLRDTGTFYLHCDPTMSHYLKVICDLLFGVSNYRNEIVWGYKFGGHSKKGFAAKHDILFRYSKTSHFVFRADLMREFETRSGWGQRKDGKLLTDWWSDIPSLNTMAGERTGYPTQKPLALLARVIQASSEEGDLVADFFCGSGTTLDAAQSLNRQWIGVDSHPISIQYTQKRLNKRYGKGLNYHVIHSQ